MFEQFYQIMVLNVLGAYSVLRELDNEPRKFWNLHTAQLVEEEVRPLAHLGETMIVRVTKSQVSSIITRQAMYVTSYEAITNG